MLRVSLHSTPPRQKQAWWGPRRRSIAAWLVAAGLICPAVLGSQTQPGSEAQSLPQHAKTGRVGDPDAEELQQLKTELESTRAQLALAQRQIERLAAHIDRLQAARSPGASAPNPTQPAGQNNPYTSLQDVVPNDQQRPEATAPGTAGLTEFEKLLAARLEEQQQTKVESASKYRVKLSGLILMNAFSTRGSVDNLDLPNLALPGTGFSGSFGATLRQTIVGLQVFGPEVAGARTSADLAVDFFGGFPLEPFGETAGIVRLRTGGAHFDWKDTSINFGQEPLFFSPLSPTSFATLAEPALSWAGNLWVWTPQLNVEHRFQTSDKTFVSVGGGVLAPLTPDVPESGVAALPGPGETSRRPAFATQVSLHSKLYEHDALFGLGAYTNHLVYNFGRETNGWAVTSFWQVPVARWLELSGEGYRGKAVGGLGGGISQNVAYNGDPGLASTQARFLNSFGGWGQLKFRIHPKWELNAAVGQDNVRANDLQWAPVLRTEYTVPWARNRIGFGNVIYRPKSNILFSAEYRKIWTYQYTGASNTADQVNLAAGVSF